MHENITSKGFEEGLEAEIIKQVDLPDHVTILIYKIRVSKYAVNDIYAVSVDNNQDEAVYYVTINENEIDKLIEKTIKELEALSVDKHEWK